jgi:hypothetical protein
MNDPNEMQSNFDSFDERFNTIMNESMSSNCDLETGYFIHDYFEEGDKVDWRRELYDLYYIG